MHEFNRREFCKAAIAGAALITGPSIAAEARTSDVPKNTKYPANPTELAHIDEVAHVPSITLKKIEANGVAYGNTPAGMFYEVSVQARHESIFEHHILSISLYVNGKRVSEYTINDDEPEFSLPAFMAVLRLNFGDELLAITECNKHGLWGNKIKVKI